MKKLLSLLLILAANMSYGQASCPYMTTYEIKSNLDSFKVVYKFIDPTNGFKSLRALVTNGTDTLYNACVNASGQQNIERTDSTTMIKSYPNAQIIFFGYTSGVCGGNPCYTSNNIPLPIKLKAFNVSTSNGIVHINWSVESKENFNRFEVERSTNGEDYSLIHTVYDGEGSDYYVQDIVMYSKAFYRLKMVDNDESYTYSPTRMIVSNSVNKMPFRVSINNVTLVSQVNDNTSVLVRIKSVSGIVLHSLTVHNGESMTLPNMAHGIYIVEIDGKPYKQLF